MDSKSEKNKIKTDTTPLDFAALPDDCKKEVLTFIDQKDQSQLVFASKSHYSLFQPTRLLNALLKHVANGNQDTAEKILKRYPQLMTEQSPFIDNALRAFNTSAFKYTVFALDAHMWTMMLKCIPQNETGETIRVQMLEQIKSLESKGLDYILLNNKGKKQSFNKKHYDFSHLTTPLQDYVSGFNTMSSSEKKAHWCKKVGGSQVLDGQNDGPVSHIIHEFCQKNSFDPTPTFSTDIQLTRTTEFYNAMSQKTDHWVTGIDGLGVQFGIMKSPLFGAGGCQEQGNLEYANHELTAINTLYQVRSEIDLPKLRNQLNTPIKNQDKTPKPKKGCVIS